MKREEKKRKADAILNVAQTMLENHVHVHIIASGKEDDPVMLVSNVDDKTVLGALHTSLGFMIVRATQEPEPEKEEPNPEEKE